MIGLLAVLVRARPGVCVYVFVSVCACAHWIDWNTTRLNKQKLRKQEMTSECMFVCIYL